jgi:predicted metalloprotease with PDZ domain
MARTPPRSDPARAAVRYRIMPVDPHAHLFEVALELDDPHPEGQVFDLPAWIPGSYMIREYARHVVAIEARSGAQPIGLVKLDKHSWRASPCAGPLSLRYQVYAWDLSVRGAHLDAGHGFFNGCCVFLRVVGRDQQACDVEIEAPAGENFRRWRVATTLARAGAAPGRFGRYRAPDYDTLIDHPVEMGEFTLVRYEAGGARHEVALTGRHEADCERLADDLRRICAAQARLFEPRSGRAPFDRYLFQVLVVGEGYGGLEHRDSTALITRRDDLPWVGMKGTTEAYRRFLGLCSHEYFHAWHVKRIKPQAFVHYRLGVENYTRLLWIFEGFTSYYDDLMLVRSGVISVEDYLTALSSTISQVLRTPGRMRQSLTDSSFDAWVKYYRQDENSPNTIVSYYAKGALVALALDCLIRAKTAGARSLDDVMRLMWQRYGRGFYDNDGRISADADGIAEDGFEAIVREATGLALGTTLRNWVEGKSELPLGRLLATMGVRLLTKAQDGAAAALGLRLADKDGRVRVSHVLWGGAAHEAGIAAGDELIALDGLRADVATLNRRINRRKPGQRIALHLFRRDELIEASVAIGKAPLTEASLRISEDGNDTATRLRTGWLGLA